MHTMIKIKNENHHKENRKKPLIKPNSLALLAVLVILLLFLINSSTNSYEQKLDSIEIDNNLFKCYDVVKNASQYFKSLGKTKPNNQQLKNYIQRHGISYDLELKNEWLIDQYYNDFNLNHLSNSGKYINNSVIETIQQLVLNNSNYNPFDDVMFNKMIVKYFKKSSHNKLGVLNWFEKDYYPWLEAILLMNTPKSYLVDLDMHTNKLFESTQIKSINLNDFLSDNLNSYLNNVYLLNEFKFNALISYNGVESIGLGKYGEEVWLDADFQYVNLINCMLKPNGLFVLTLSVNDEDKSHLEFNTRRVYGKNRLNNLLLNSNNWILLDRLKYNHGNQEIFVLQKI